MKTVIIFTVLLGAVVLGQQYNQNPYLSGNSNRINPQNGARQQNLQSSRFNEVQAAPKNNINCPDKNGRYPDGDQCDAYIECQGGIGERKLCPEGLMFNTEASFFSYPCEFPNKVDCSGRPRSQPAEPTELCPHQYGYFRGSNDPAQCGEFKICSAGVAHVLQCPVGLAFSSLDYNCDWPDLVADCDAESYLGFKCPEIRIDPFFGEPEYRFYKSPSDCKKYFLCIHGRPRQFSCAEDEAYNEEIQACDGLENVTSCAGTLRKPQLIDTRFSANNNYDQRQNNYRG